MVWRFGGYNPELHKTEIDPPMAVYIDENIFFRGAAAVLYGQTGRIQLELIVPSNFHQIGLGRKIHQKMEILLAEQLFPKSVFEECVEANGSGYNVVYSMNFSPRSGESFTRTAFRGFLEILNRLTNSKFSEQPPVPIVNSETFWQVGEDRISFGIAAALDQYLDGGFREIQKAYAKDGAPAASRLYLRLRHQLRNSDDRDKTMLDIEGAEILLGCEDRNSENGPFFHYALCVDGYDEGSGSGTSFDSILEHAAHCVKQMNKYGIRHFTLSNGFHFGKPGRGRVQCEVLTRHELNHFLSTMYSGRCFIKERDKT